jgi:hypothetical protein
MMARRILYFKRYPTVNRDSLNSLIIETVIKPAAQE